MCIISVMDTTILDKIVPFVSLGMLTIFLVFLIIGALFGLCRGVKRASLRLLLFVGMLLIAFFLTPVIVNGALHSNVQIFGSTPQEYVDRASDKVFKYLQQNAGDYVVPFQDYIQDYALGIVLAVLNIAVFYALYFLIKFVGWIIYAVIAHFSAPKRTKDGKKIKKYAGWGALIGAVQGIVLFVVFLFPVNGLLGVVNHAAEYQAQHTQNQSTIQTQSTGRDNNSTQIDIENILQKVDAPLKGYNAFMKYSGIEFFSAKAFEYQLTVRIENGQDISLVHDLNSGLELVVDAQNVMKVLEKMQAATQNGRLDLTNLTTQDYTVLRDFINKTFDLQILSVANNLMRDMDKIFATPFNDDLTLVEGTDDVYVNSIYGVLVKNGTTQRDVGQTLTAEETNYTKYAAGLQAAVKYIGGKGLNLIRQDLLNAVDFVEKLNIYKVTYDGLPSKTVAEILAQDNLGAREYFDLSTAKLDNTYGNYDRGEYLIYVLGDRLVHLATVEMVGLEDLDNLLLYSKAMDNMFDNDADLKKLVIDLIPMFVGKNALNHQNAEGVAVEGNWPKLGKDIVDVAHVLRNYVTALDDIEAKKEALRGKGYSDSRLQMEAVLGYMADLVISQDYYTAHKDTEFAGKAYDEIKYQKIDNLVDALYRLIEDFPPVKDFVKSKLATMKSSDEGDYVQMLIDMLDSGKQQWKDTLHNIVNVANIINNSKLGDLIDKIQNSSPEDIAKDFINSVSELNQEDVVDMINSVLDVPQIGDAVQDSLGKILDEVNDKTKTSDAELEKLLVGEGNTMDANDLKAVRDKMTAVQNDLTELNKDTITPEKKAELESELPNKIGNLWGEIQKYKPNMNGVGAYSKIAC